MRSRVLGIGVATALLGSTLVAVAPAASAAVGDTTKFPFPDGFRNSLGMLAAADGTLWLSPYAGKALANVSMKGEFTLHPLSILAKPVEGYGIAQMPDGRIWFAEHTGFSLVNTDASGSGSKQTFPATSIEQPYDVTAGPDGNVWFTTTTQVRRLNPNGSVSTFNTPLKDLGDIAAGPGNWLAFAAWGSPAVGRITTDGVVTTIPLPEKPNHLNVAPDGTIWAATEFSDYRISPSGAVTKVITGYQGGSSVAFASDGSTWAACNACEKVARVAADGTLTTFASKGSATDMQFGADGNMWILTIGNVTRILTGITPASTKAPVVSGAANTPGSVLSSDKGEWKFLPSSQSFQWQRCTANDPASCSKIADADKASYTITDADKGMWLQSTVTAKNLNGNSKPAGSALFQVAPKATAPTQPTNPTPAGPAPVTGVGKATIVTGVIAKLGGPLSVKRKAKRAYAVTFTSPTPRGAVKFSLINSAGAEAFVLNAGKTVGKKGKKASRAIIAARIPKAVPKGAYTLVAVYTPAADQAATYPVTTLTKPLTLR